MKSHAREEDAGTCPPFGPRDPRTSRTAELILVAIVALVGTTGPALAQTISVSSDPSQMIIDSAQPGSSPNGDSDASTTYDVSTDSTSTVLVRLAQSTPTGVTLEAKLEAPTGATSQGYVELTTVDQQAVTSVDPGDYSNLKITYRLSATVGAGTVSLTSRDVVLTISTN